ncbi:MAG: DegT/DnrJ/EryC1/StrS family aminotransferase [Clostridia bacterium]
MKELEKALAVNGGPKTIGTSLPNRFNVNEQEKKAVCALFDEASSTGVAPGYSGKEEELLCDEFAAWMGGGYSDGVNSGSTAVFVALRAMEIEPFSEVIVSAVTDPGGIMPIVMNNCIPVVADTTMDSYNCGPEQIRDKITEHTRAVVVSHILGEPADMEGIMDIAHAHGLKVIEDCSQSHGATIHGRKVGTFGHAAAFSTMFGKHFNTGGQGGLVFTKDEATYWKIRRHADRGKPFGLPGGSTNEVASLNFNLSEISSVIGRVQLRKLDGLIEKRRKLVSYFNERIKSQKAISSPSLIPGARGSYWYLRLDCNADALVCTKNEFLEAVAGEGVLLMKDYSFALPYKFDWFKNKNAFGRDGFPWTAPQYKGTAGNEVHCPNVEHVIERCFNLHVYESWTEQDMDLIFKAFQKAEDAYAR